MLSSLPLTAVTARVHIRSRGAIRLGALSVTLGFSAANFAACSPESTIRKRDDAVTGGAPATGGAPGLAGSEGRAGNHARGGTGAAAGNAGSATAGNGSSGEAALAGSAAALAGSTAASGAAGSNAGGSGGSAGSAVGAGGSGSGGVAGTLGGGGEPSAGEAGAAPTPEVRMKNGLPIGDCTESTQEELVAEGCPPSLPDPTAPCSEPNKACYYEIRTDDPSRSVQPVFSCSQGTWGVGMLLGCGTSCATSVGNDVPLEMRDCDERAAAECTTDDVVYAVPPNAQTKLDHQLEKLVRECSGGNLPFDNTIQVKLTRGCPSSFSATASLDPDVADCLKQTLPTLRWSCGEVLVCGTWAAYLL